MSLTIKFSHKYDKLRAMDEHEQPKLLQVLDVELSDLSPDFLDYDTAIVGGGYYKLPKKGKYLLLMFEGNHGLFTTLRAAWPPQKAAFYRNNIGNRFTVERLA